MDFASVEHRPTGAMCYMLDEDHVVINIKTGMDIERVTLVHADPYLNPALGSNPGSLWEFRKEMVFDKELLDQKWWTTTVRPQWKHLKYHFELESREEAYALFEERFLTMEQVRLNGGRLSDFFIDWMNVRNMVRTPEWARDTVWYQIFPDRFHRGDGSQQDAQITPWRDEGTVGSDERFGGDLRGITEKLPYLAELGISGIYLMPVCEAGYVHRYDTYDYLRIDPRLGKDEDMVELVRTAHGLGIRVMMDGVFNHCGLGFKPWMDVLEHGERSRYLTWFFINSFPLDTDRDTRDSRYYSFSFCADMPKINTNSEEVIEYFEKVCLTWINKYDIDGIRIDACNEISHYFLKRLNATIKKVRPDFYLLGETWHDATQSLSVDELDSVTNYMFSNIIDWFFNIGLTRCNFIHEMNKCYTRYQDQFNRCIFNLLDSHDTIRLASRSNSFEEFIQQLTILLTFPGSPCLYYGTEIALEGLGDPDCRRCMSWSRMDTDSRQRAYRMVRSLIRVRNEHPALRSTRYEFTEQYQNDRLLEYNRYDSHGNCVRILINASASDVCAEIAQGRVLFSIEWDGGRLCPGGVCIYSQETGSPVRNP